MDPLQRFAVLAIDELYAAERDRNQVLMLAVLEARRRRRQRERERRPRSCWQRPWVALRRNMGKVAHIILQETPPKNPLYTPTNTPLPPQPTPACQMKKLNSCSIIYVEMCFKYYV
jgi:hypothetical protein